MKQRRIVVSPEARTDLMEFYDWIADKASPTIAVAHVERLEAFCRNLETASERGFGRDGIRPGLRIVGFERRIAIAFAASEDMVTILRPHYGGQNWETPED